MRDLVLPKLGFIGQVGVIPSSRRGKQIHTEFYVLQLHIGFVFILPEDNSVLISYCISSK